MNEKKVVYITGCLGFIGSYVTRGALRLGWYVRGVDKITYASDVTLLDEFNKYDNFVFEQTDINDIKFLYECDVIVNLAAETHVGNSIVKSDEFVKSNINGVHHLLELLKDYRHEGGKKPRFIQISTDEVYGDIDSGLHRETDILKPSNPYSATKAAADMLVQSYSRTYNIPYNIVRPTNNYGIGQYCEKLIPKTIKYLGLHKHIPLHNNGDPVRTWLHAGDTAAAILTIILSAPSGEIYKVSGGFELMNREVVNKIINLYWNVTINSDVYIDNSYSRPGQDIRYALDDSKIRQLGWEPQLKFDDMLPSIVEHYKNNFIW